jgi:hypothetical protein
MFQRKKNEQKDNSQDIEIISQELFEEQIYHYQYSLGHIYAFISLILSATPMRCVSRVLDFFQPLLKTDLPAPSWYSGRLWLMKLGYYKLHAPKTQAQDWIWIVGHSVQLGSEKCFVILGVRASGLNKRDDLTLSLEDVEPIALSPVKTSNGDVVYQQLVNASHKTGTPMAIVGDKGPDLHCGVNKFCNGTGTLYIYDIKHKVALLLKKHFEQDPHWKSFCEMATKTQQYVRQTDIAGAAPPNQRSKARYMNVDSLIQWAIDMLTILDKGVPKEYDEKQFKAKIGWVIYYRQDILKWQKIMSFAVTTEMTVRKQGIKLGITEQLQREFQKLNFCPTSSMVRDQLIAAVMQEEAKVGMAHILLGSSEIIESLFGRFKYLEQAQSSSGFTGLVLALAALVAKTTSTIIKQAMTSVTVNKLKEWFDENIGQSVQAQRVMINAYANDTKTG